MNSQKKLYDELLKEHPELKESNVDIPEVISLMQELNPDIVANQDYKDTLKQRLDTIANYNPKKSSNIFWFLKYFIPVFSFGFAVFGFVYFSDDFQPQPIKSDSHIQSKSIQQASVPENAPAEMMMLSDMAESDMLDEAPISAQASMKSKSLRTTRNMTVSDNQATDSENIINDNKEISDELLDEVMPMMFSMDSMLSDESDNGFTEESENLEIMWMTESSVEEKIEDTFSDICWEYNGLISILEDEIRTCILENKNCDETDYIEKKCFESINVTK